jgi:triosephosphate isomerase (TIM)
VKIVESSPKSLLILPISYNRYSSRIPIFDEGGDQMQRKYFVGGNWKMNTTLESACELVRGLAGQLGGDCSVEVSVYPPFPYLLSVQSILREREVGIRLGAQNIWEKPAGAYTGEVSAEMVLECGAQSVLIGHSERRHVIGETDEMINRKVHRALDAGLKVVLCVGETLDQREAGETDAVNERQVRLGLREVPVEALDQVVIAYEPVWAIGTGRSATAQDAQNAHERIRSVLSGLFDTAASEAMRVIYGGSVKSANAGELFACPDIDGGLIGGASLDAGEFAKIVRACVEKEPAS